MTYRQTPASPPAPQQASDLHGLLENAPVPLMVVNGNGILYANFALSDLLGHSPDELTQGMTLQDLIVRLDTGRDPDSVESLPPVHVRTHVLCRKKDNNVLAVGLHRWAARYRGEEVVAVAFVPSRTDDCSGAADVLGRAEALSISGACEYDVVTGLLTRSPGLFNLFGEEPEDAPAWVDWLVDRVPPAERELVRSILEGDRPGMPREIEHSIRRRDGSLRTVSHRSVTEVDGRGRAYRTISVLQDITARNAAEEERLATRLPSRT